MKKLAPLLIMIAGILWGCMGIFVRKLNAEGLFSMEIVALRATVTCIAMGVFLLIYDWHLFRIHLKDLWCFLGTGIMSIVFFNYCYFKAMTVASLSVAAVLLYMAPAIVMVLSYFLFQEAFTKHKVLALLLTFIGCILVTSVITNPGTVTGAGILAGLGAGFGYALYSIFGRYAIEKGYHTFTITFYTFLFAALGTWIFTDQQRIFLVATGNTGNLLVCLSLGILGTVVPYLTYTLGLKYVDNSRASIIASVEPVTATILGVVLFHERISVSGVLGIVLVIAALFICNSREKENEASHEQG